MRFDAANRIFFGTPANQDVGVIDLQLVATDLSGLSASLNFALTVVNTNDAPVLFLIGDQATTPGTPLDVQTPFEDVDLGDQHVITAQSSNPDAVTTEVVVADDGHTHVVLSPVDGFEGTVDITVTVTDDAEAPATDAETFTLTVTDSNRAPVISFIQSKSPNKSRRSISS